MGVLNEMPLPFISPFEVKGRLFDYDNEVK